MDEYIAGPADAGKRVDRFIGEKRGDLSRVFILKALRLKKIKRNGKRAEGKDRLAVGDVVTSYVPHGERRERPVGTDGFRLVYEDAHILVADKRAGLLSEDLSGEVRDTLEEEVRAYLAPKGETARLCHRIDYNTSGLVVLAKDRESLAVMNEAIRAREIHKRYLAVVVGRPRAEEGELRHYLFKDAKKNRVYLSETPVKGSRTAVMRYQVLAAADGLSLVGCDLVTGRTHQIRSQMAAAGCPLLGDDKYGSKQVNRSRGERRQLLCSYRITLDFKDTGHILGYLAGRTFEVETVDFVRKYFPRWRGR